MPTIAGLRRRGYTPQAIRDFCERIGVSKANSTVDVALLEHCVREDLKTKVQSRNVVEDPIKIVITNYPEDRTEEMEMCIRDRMNTGMNLRWKGTGKKEKHLLKKNICI